jgi:hypothetical protein
VKYNMHIRLASTAFEYLRNSFDTLRTTTGHSPRAPSRPFVPKAERLQHPNLTHPDANIRASCVPDEIITCTHLARDLLDRGEKNSAVKSLGHLRNARCLPKPNMQRAALRDAADTGR